MVFQTVALMIRSKGPDQFWKKRRIFRLAAVLVVFSLYAPMQTCGCRYTCYHVLLYFVPNCFALSGTDCVEILMYYLLSKMFFHFVGRRRNCYSIAIRNVHRALAYATQGRKLKKEDMAELWETRISAGSEQYGLPYGHLREGLHRSTILLNRKTLADLAIWEPFSFKALTQIAWTKMHGDGDSEAKDIDAVPPSNVFIAPTK